MTVCNLFLKRSSRLTSHELESLLEHPRVAQRVKGSIQQVIKVVLGGGVGVGRGARTGLLVSLPHYRKCIPGPDAGRGHRNQSSPLRDDPAGTGQDLQDNRECLVEAYSFKRL